MTKEYTHEARLYAWPPTREVADVLTLRLTEDTGWMPRFTATVTVVTTPELLATPLEYLTVEMNRVDGPGHRPKAWTRTWFGSVSAMTRSAATSPAAITAQGGGRRAAGSSQRIRVTMLARSYTHDLTQGTTTITLTSCEMRLADLRRLIAPAYHQLQTGGAWVRDEGFYPPGGIVTASNYVGGLLTEIGASLIERPVTDRIGTEEYEWQTGDSPDSVLRELLEDVDMILYATSPTAYVLRGRETVGPVRTLGPGTCTSLGYTVDLSAAQLGGMKITESNQGGYVTVQYFGNAPGLIPGHYSEVSRDGNPPATHSLTVKRSPSRVRTGSRQHVITAEMPADYTIRADDRARVIIPGVFDRTGSIASITYQYPEGIASLDIESTQPAS